jgi:hypothetical protein
MMNRNLAVVQAANKRLVTHDVRSVIGDLFTLVETRHAGFMSDPEPTTLRDVSRRAIIFVLCNRPSWRLSQLAEYINKDEPYAELLGSVTIEELRVANELESCDGNEPPINRWRLTRATQASGEKYDGIVLEVIEEARSPVTAAYLERRVGGPRWKRQASLRRLVAAGLIERRGSTSSTNYRVARGQA